MREFPHDCGTVDTYAMSPQYINSLKWSKDEQSGRERERVSVRACVRACVLACECVCACVRTCVSACMRAWVCVFGHRVHGIIQSVGVYTGRKNIYRIYVLSLQ